MAATLTGRVAVVTGAGRGIGAAIAQRFAAEGAAVLLADLDGGAAQEVAARVRSAGGSAWGVAVDVGDPDSVDRLFASAAEQAGPVDVLVNNAAITDDVRHLFDGGVEWWEKYLRVNLTGQYLCLDRAARVMAPRRRGSIINVSSGAATKAHRGMVAYDAAKGGVEALTRAAALELAPYGIRVNTLVPGLIGTTEDEPTQRRELRDATVPLGRGGVAADLAGPAVFLAGDDAAYVTGTRVVVDGGVLAGQRSPQVDTFPVTSFPEVPEVPAR